MPTKILEIKGKQLMAGLSFQASFPMGGIWKQITNFNPFNRMGLCVGTVAPTVNSGTAIGNVPKYIQSFGTASFIFGDKVSSKTLYQMVTATGVVTDISSSILTSGTGIANLLAVFKGYLIYGMDGNLRSWDFNATDVAILGSAGLSSTNAFGSHDWAIGADLNFYYTSVTQHAIGKIILFTGTSGNSNNVFQLESDMYPRSLCNDGRYLVVVADSNTSKNVNLTARCRVYFWDMAATSASVIWDIPDVYLVACRYIRGMVLVWGYKGIWACTSGAAPRLIVPFFTAETIKSPTLASSVVASDNNAFWVDDSGTANGNLYCYGGKGEKPIVFTPALLNSSLPTALCASGNLVIGATSTPDVSIMNIYSSGGDATIQTAYETLDNPYQFTYAKVSLKKPLTSGQAVQFALYSQDGTVVSTQQTKAFSDTDIGSKQTLIFFPQFTAGAESTFEELSAYAKALQGALIERITVYGTPQTDNQQI